MIYKKRKYEKRSNFWKDVKERTLWAEKMIEKKYEKLDKKNKKTWFGRIKNNQ